MTSDSMTNVEMQDVLSSIRRLVSVEKTEKKEAKLQGEDRFILTPAHRVTNEDTEAEPNQDEVPEFLMRRELVPPAESDDSIEDQAGATPPASDSAPLETDTENRPDPWLDGMPGFNRSESDPDLSPFETAESSSDSLEMRIAELEVAVGRADEEWEPDGSEPEAGIPPERHIFEVVGNKPDREPETEPDNPEAPLQLSEVAMFSHIPRPPKDPEVTHIPESRIDRSLDNRRTAETTSRATAGDVVDNDDDVFVDEDILRRVVTEIVREELQGKLGERITRNVRRMVRREIEQTLSLKNFD